MKDELQDKLVEILTALQTNIGNGADFALDQLPDIAQQYVLYGRVWLAVSVLIWSIITVLVAWVTLKYGYLSKGTDNHNTDNKNTWSDARIGVTIVGTFTFILVIWIFLAMLRDASLVWLAPKVWLIREVAGMLK